MNPLDSGRRGRFTPNPPPGLTVPAHLPRLDQSSSTLLHLQASPMARSSTAPYQTWSLPSPSPLPDLATNSYSPLADSVTGNMNTPYFIDDLEGCGLRRGSSTASFPSPVTPPDYMLDVGEPQMMTGLSIGGGEFAFQPFPPISHHPHQLAFPMPNNPSGGMGLLQLQGQGLENHQTGANLNTNGHVLSGPDISTIPIPTTAQPAGKLPRQQRMRLSCDQCYKNKVKCTKAKPMCAHCVSHGGECRYSPKAQPAQGSKNSKASKRKASVDVGAPQSSHGSHSMAMLASETQAKVYPGAGYELPFGIPHPQEQGFLAPWMPASCTCSSVSLAELGFLGKLEHGDNLNILNIAISSLRNSVKLSQTRCGYCTLDAIPGAAAKRLGDFLMSAQHHYKVVARRHMELRGSSNSSGMYPWPDTPGWHTKSENELDSWWKIDVDVIDNDIYHINCLMLEFQRLWALAMGLDQNLDYLGNNLPALVHSAVVDLQLVKTTGRAWEHYYELEAELEASTPGEHEPPSLVFDAPLFPGIGPYQG